ncbi:hypothetical protein ACFV0D_33965 [Streptomyces sp. NPDC059556]|uniref:hypothetical protein n=1 Tax=Streptomyces sp. NPDC059556 TaxID=3346863 RepID=UPI0036D0A623
MERRMRVCGHCQESFALASTGRPPKYCSATCRKAAFDKRRLDEAVVAAVAKAVAAERRRSNRGNETRTPAENRGNETPAAAPPVPRLLPAPSARPTIPLPDPAVPMSKRRSLFPPFRPAQAPLFEESAGED